MATFLSEFNTFQSYFVFVLQYVLQILTGETLSPEENPEVALERPEGPEEKSQNGFTTRQNYFYLIVSQ